MSAGLEARCAWDVTLVALRRHGQLRTTQVGLAMPLVVNAAQQHGTVELERAFGKERFVVEKIRSGLLDLKRLNPPVEAVQLQALKAPRVTRRRIAERTA